jgi:3-oxoacyl-[acyl-carrier protein] reductase
MGRLEGKVAVVTGAARGIGRGVSRRFAQEGASVVVADVIEAEGKQVAVELEELGGVGHFVRTDVSRRDDVFAAVASATGTYGRVDVLVNCAIALSPHLPFEEKTDAMHRWVLRVGVFGTLWGMQAVFPHMKEQGGGRIINFDSFAKFNGQLHTADYDATKGGIGGLTTSAAAEWARYGILVNAISPASFSMGTDKMVEQAPALLDYIATLPLGRIGDPEMDIAPAALFLASDDSRFVTGQTMVVDGGMFNLSTNPMFAVDSPERVDAWLRRPFNVQE